MKKTLLALAAIAASSAAFAQSSVTLYGVVDASVESVKGTKTVNRVSSDNLSSSRWGIKGTEDMGNGLKANFVLESPLKSDTGAAGNDKGQLFDRQSWVGLAGGFGEVRLGRTDSVVGDIAGNVLSAQPYDDLKIVKTRGGDSYRRVSNSINYILPAVVPGLAVTLQYSTGAGTGAATSPSPNGEVAGSSEGRTYGLSAKYVAGPLSAGVAYQFAKDEVANATLVGNQKANATLGYAAYDFGLAKVTAYYDVETNLKNLTATAAVPARRLSVTGAKVAVPVSPDFTLTVGGSIARNVKNDGNSASDIQIVTIKGVYNLSKRTSVYGMFTNVNNDTASTSAIDSTNVPVAAGKTTRGIAAGVRHSF